MRARTIHVDGTDLIVELIVRPNCDHPDYPLIKSDAIQGRTFSEFSSARGIDTFTIVLPSGRRLAVDMNEKPETSYIHARSFSFLKLIFAVKRGQTEVNAYRPFAVDLAEGRKIRAGLIFDGEVAFSFLLADCIADRLN